MNIELRYAARSDVGPVRAKNEDSAYAGPNLLVVADGMGGHAGGNVASRIAINALKGLDAEDHTPGTALEALEEAISNARANLITVSAANPHLHGMGSTVTALMRTGSTLVMAHMGDSRAYLLRDGELVQITVDHTFVQHLVDTGRISPEEAEHHPRRNIVTRVLTDFDQDLHPDLSIREARAGDRWLLCSDGLSGFVPLDAIRSILATRNEPAEAAEALIAAARAVPSTDNITALVADVTIPEISPPGLAPESDGVQIVGAAAETGPEASLLAAPTTSALPVVSQDFDPILDDHADHPDDVFEEFDDEGLPPVRRRPWIAAVVSTVVLAGIGVGLWQAYAWTQRQYFVASSSGQVAIYRGIPQDLGPIRLSTPVELLDTPVAALPDFIAVRLEGTIRASSLQEARHVAEALVEEAEEFLPEGEVTD